MVHEREVTLAEKTARLRRPAAVVDAFLVPVAPEATPAVSAQRAAAAAVVKAKEVEAETRLVVATTENRAAQRQAEILDVAQQLILDQLQKYLKLSQSPDFKDAIGPVDPKVILKLAEFAAKYTRLDNNQSTENVAHQVRTTVDFSKLSQEDRNLYRELALKAGVEG